MFLQHVKNSQILWLNVPLHMNSIPYFTINTLDFLENPWKHQKTLSIERDQQHEMG